MSYAATGEGVELDFDHKKCTCALFGCTFHMHMSDVHVQLCTYDERMCTTAIALMMCTSYVHSACH